MKEEICSSILKADELNKWWLTIKLELEDDKWESLIKTIETANGKRKNELSINRRDGVIELKMYKRKWGGKFDKKLAEIYYDAKEIWVHDKILYDFCKRFGMEHKFKKLKKCWLGVMHEKKPY